VESLFARASRIDISECTLPSGHVARLRHIFIPLGRASPDRLKEGALQATYTSKPLVTFNGAAMFGELAVLRWLNVDGWDGVWLDTFHGRKHWREMPTVVSPVELPPPARALYDRIVAENGGKASGAFDVMAWRGSQFVFLEYKGPGDRPNRNQPRWIDAALRAGVSEADLLLISGVER
jgi:hypothetical protein